MPKKPSPAAPVVADTPAPIHVADTPAPEKPTPFAPTPAPSPTEPPMPAVAPTPAPAPLAPAVEPASHAPAPALNVAAYQARQYPEPRCWSLVTAIYTEVLGQQPTEVQTVTESMRDASRAFRLALFKTADGLQRCPQPTDFAIVLMWPSKGKRRPHCGIYFAGKVLHATPEANLYQDVASLKDTYPSMEFWKA